MMNVNVGFTINPKIIEIEYDHLVDASFIKLSRDIEFSLEEFSQYLHIILNSTIKRSGGTATTPFQIGDAPISNTISVALTSVGNYIDPIRNMIFTPISNHKEFALSEGKFQFIAMQCLKFGRALSLVNRVPGPRSSEIKEVMTSRVVDSTIYAINDSISPIAITNCAIVLPTPNKEIAFAEQQNVNIEILNYSSRIVKG